MTGRSRIRELAATVRRTAFVLGNTGKKKFHCPACGFRGPFRDLVMPTGVRRHAKCPRCDALERHRFQIVAINRLLEGLNASAMRMLHLAPEPCLRNIFARRFGHYLTADLDSKGVDCFLDVQKMPFGDARFDIVFASHVLEHVRDDARALAELRRILGPEGIAILAVPIVAERTVEYSTPNPFESGHVRAPGLDYSDRYVQHFSRVENITSESIPEEFQGFIYEDRSHWPTAECPLRPPMQGERHVDIVSICYV